MRIVILGDFHLSPTQPHIADEAMEDVNEIHPDLIIPLGDFGAGNIGSPAGLEEAWQHLRKLDAPLRPILGNHDLQQESGGKREHYSIIKALQEINGGDVGGGFMEFENFRFMFVSTDPQPADSCWQVQECYVAPEQFENLMEQFQQRPGVPIFVFSHAPPIGCGLRTAPAVHVRSTNAYLDQNHDPYRWEALYRNHPEFLLWFSAHYHLGHDHPNSTTDICGTHFFQTQIHGLQTRDGTRQSRVLDIAPDSITVSTLDHVTRQLTKKSQWRFDGSATKLMQHKQQEMTSGRQPELRFAISDTPLPGCVHALSANRILVGTVDGFLWEAELSTRSVLGSYHVGAALTGVALTEKSLWRSWDNNIVRVPRNELASFVRVAKPESIPGHLYRITELVISLAIMNNTIIALSQTHLWKYNPDSDEFDRISALPVSPIQGMARNWQGHVIISSVDGQLWIEDSNNKWEQLEHDVLFWQCHENQLAIGTTKGIYILNGKERTEYLLPVTLSAEDRIAPLSDGKWLLAHGVDLWELDAGKVLLRGNLKDDRPQALLSLPGDQNIIAITDNNEVIPIHATTVIQR